jgi:hypothetical protein
MLIMIKELMVKKSVCIECKEKDLKKNFVLAQTKNTFSHVI